MTQALVRQEKIAQIARASAKLREKQEARAYEGGLMDFASYVWPVVEPNIPFVKGWAISAIAEHLEAVTAGHLKRLLINVPPGFSKSLLTDVFWPAWEWGPKNRPWYRYICAAYSSHLTERDNMRARNIVMSDRYQRLWSDRFKISNEQFTKVKFANDKTGWKLATSVGGVGTGERGDRVIIDDANDPIGTESEAIRYNTNMWFTEVIPDRLNNPRESAIVVIQQRLHEEDVSGVAISRELGYTHLMIPMRYEPERSYYTVLGINPDGTEKIWEDPREEDGELAWPERFTPESVDGLERAKGPYAFAGQYQQNPAPRGGAIIKYSFWQKWTKAEWPDNMSFVIASLDTAYTEKEENDPSAMSIWAVFKDDYGNVKVILKDCWQERLELHDLVQKVITTCKRHEVDRLLIESKASGISVSQEVRRIIGFSSNFGIELIDPRKQGDKVARAHAVVHMFSDGMIYAPQVTDEDGAKDWTDFANLMIKQAATFPKGSHDDLVDSATMALRYLRNMNFALRREETDFAREHDLMYRSRPAPLYQV